MSDTYELFGVISYSKQILAYISKFKHVKHGWKAAKFHGSFKKINLGKIYF